MGDELARELIIQIKRNNDLMEAFLKKFDVMPEDTVLTFKDAAKIAGVTRQTIAEYVRQKRLHKVQLGGKRGVLASELKKIQPVS